MYTDSTTVPTIAQTQSPIATERLVRFRSYPQLAPGTANAKTSIVWNAFADGAPRVKSIASKPTPKVINIRVRILIVAMFTVVELSQDSVNDHRAAAIDSKAEKAARPAAPCASYNCDKRDDKHQLPKLEFHRSASH